MNFLRCLTPAFLMFQIAAFAGGSALFIAFGTLPAVLPAMGMLSAIGLIGSLAMTITVAFGIVLFARKMIVDEVARLKAGLGSTLDRNVEAFFNGTGVLMLFCTPLLSLLLVSMISVAGPIASAIALGLVVSGVMSLLNARSVFEALAKLKHTTPIACVPVIWPRSEFVIIVMVLFLTAAPAMKLTSDARIAALRHTRTALDLVAAQIDSRAKYLNDTKRAFASRLAHDLDMLKRERERAARGHASQTDIDVLQSRALALETEALRAQSDAEENLARSHREREDLVTKEIALAGLAPALGR